MFNNFFSWKRQFGFPHHLPWGHIRLLPLSPGMSLGRSTIVTLSSVCITFFGLSWLKFLPLMLQHPKFCHLSPKLPLPNVSGSILTCPLYPWVPRYCRFSSLNASCLFLLIYTLLLIASIQAIVISDLDWCSSLLISFSASNIASFLSGFLLYAAQNFPGWPTW